ncbi:MAG: 3TM-type holin, partial [Pseudomonadota bacterium]
MGIIDGIFGTLFGGRQNVVRDTIEVFRENSEAGAARAHEVRLGALNQFAAEFAHARHNPFDRLIDGLNRIPRPAMALGTLGLFASAMMAPEW